MSHDPRTCDDCRSESDATCETCRYHSTEGHEVWDHEANNGEGDYVTSRQRRCLRILHGNGDDRRVRDWPAMVCDGSGYAATLYTLASFGCSLHEGRAAISDRLGREPK